MNLNEKQTLEAMINFLKEYYDRGKSDDIAVLLGGLSILEDGTTADPALWSDWLIAIKKAVEKSK